jgi:hypothetical protein
MIPRPVQNPVDDYGLTLDAVEDLVGESIRQHSPEIAVVNRLAQRPPGFPRCS